MSDKYFKGPVIKRKTDDHASFRTFWKLAVLDTSVLFFLLVLALTATATHIHLTLSLLLPLSLSLSLEARMCERKKKRTIRMKAGASYRFELRFEAVIFSHCFRVYAVHQLSSVG